MKIYETFASVNDYFKIDEEATDSCGWIFVRSLSAYSNEWHPATDKLKGTDANDIIVNDYDKKY